MITGRDDEMARLATSHACVDRRAPVISRVVSRVYRSGLLWASTPRTVSLQWSSWHRRGGGVFGVRPWRSSAQPERLLASGRWALRHPS